MSFIFTDRQLTELANHHYFVVMGEQCSEEDQAKWTISLSKKLGITIRSGHEYVNKDVFRFASEYIGVKVPETFYRGFPQTVYDLTPDKLLIDQLVHYYITYGLGQFDVDGRSLFEAQVKRTAFDNKFTEKIFYIITVEEARNKLKEIVEGYLASTRPLNVNSYNLVKEYFEDKDNCMITNPQIASKNTAIKLLIDSKNKIYASSVNLSDFPKIVEELNYNYYNNEDIKNLNLKNQDRKFLSRVLDTLLYNHGKKLSNNVLLEVLEKKKVWKGILHHIHYDYKYGYCNALKDIIYDERAKSGLSIIEKDIESGDIRKAVDDMVKFKGPNYVLRNLNYLLSRLNNIDELKYVADAISKSDNPIMLLQLKMKIRSMADGDTSPRVFKFNKFNKTKVHKEKAAEYNRSKTAKINHTYFNLLAEYIDKAYENLYKGTLGKVFIDEGMEYVAVPLQEGATSSGFGVLPQGSRTPLNYNTLRVFTYWSKVNDIDLSAFGVTSDFKKREFSWRTMWGTQGRSITFSGDITSGYNGAMECFDINVESFCKEYPGIKYIVFCNNIYTFGPQFKDVECIAGFMNRADATKGKVYEPKSVIAKMELKGDSKYCVMMALDLDKNEAVWLNINFDSALSVAGSNTKYIDAIKPLLTSTEVMNVSKLYSMLSTEVVEDSYDADVIISDNPQYENSEYQDKVIIHSYDVDKHLKYLNKK